MNKIKVGVCFSLCSLAAPSMAQYMWQEEDGTEKIDLREDIQYGVEMQGSFSKGKTPLWLNANKHGLSSLEKNNGYLRGSLVRPLSADSARRWAVGYGVDVAVPVNYTSNAGEDILKDEPFECPMAPFGGIEQLAWSPDSTF